MKRSSLIIKLGSLALISVMAFSLTACGKDKKKSETKDKEEETSETTTAAPTTTATTVPIYSGPMTNDVAVSWEEQQLEAPTVRYVKTTGDFINVRKGPSTEYDVVAKLANKMQIVVVATTDSGWYKTSDGFYVSGDLLSETAE